MSLSVDIHAGDWGTLIRLWAKNGTAAVDISGATTKNLIFKKPDGSTLTVAGTYVTDGTDGGLYYLTVDGNVGDTEDGLWGVQMHIITANGDWKSQVKYFEVLPNLA